MIVSFKKTGRFFREKRIHAKLSQQVVAKALSYKTSQMISNWERGLCLPPTDKLYSLSVLYKMSRKEILKLYLAEVEKELKKNLKLSGFAKS
jgi:transcriptional regulator with XRE-family HTH domain